MTHVGRHFFSRHPEVVIILAGVAAALHVGKLPPAIPVLRDALGVSLVQAGFLLSLVQLAGMLLGLFVGLAADGWGLRRAMLTGLLTLSVAGTLGSLAQGPQELLVLRACEGFGILLSTMPGPGMIRRLTPLARMQATMGLWGGYMPLGTALAIACGPVAIGLLGWRLWWLTPALVTAAMALWVYLAVAPDPVLATGPVDSAASHDGPLVARLAWLQRVGRTLGAPGPWLVGCCFALYAAQWLAVIGFLPSMAGQAGASSPDMALLLALVALVNIIGNVASGRLLQRGAPPQRLLVVGFATMAVTAVLAFADVPWIGDPQGNLLLRYLAVVMFSTVGGLIPGTLFSLAVRLAPDEGSVSTTVGWMQQLSSFGQFVGPPVVAWVAAQAGGWQWTWMVTASCCAIGIGLAAWMGQEVARGRH